MLQKKVYVACLNNEIQKNTVV